MRHLNSKLFLLSIICLLLISCESLQNAMPGNNGGDETGEQQDGANQDGGIAAVDDGAQNAAGEGQTVDANGNIVVLPQVGDGSDVAPGEEGYPVNVPSVQQDAYPAGDSALQPQGDVATAYPYPVEGDGGDSGAAVAGDNTGTDDGGNMAASADSIDAFDQTLRSALSSRDFAMLNASMAEPFNIAWWQSEGTTMSAAEGTTELQNRYLPDGASVTFESADLAGLLDGQNPFAMLGPDGNVQRVLFSRGWMDGTADAMIFISQEADGRLVWDTLLVAPQGFAPVEDQGASLDAFDQALRGAIVARNYDFLRDAMADPFVIGLWRSEGMALEPVLAVEQMRTSYLPAGGDISFDSADLAALLDGQDPFAIFGPDANIQRVLYSRGWLGGTGEVMVFIGKNADGQLNWHGLLLAPEGFAAANPSPLVPTRLTFAAGESSATVDGTLTTGQIDKFAVHALEGQLMTVALESSNSDVLLAITGVDDGAVLLDHAAGQAGYADTLATTQDYIISALATGQATRYMMVIEINNN